jgi:hypothetical protein
LRIGFDFSGSKIPKIIQLEAISYSIAVQNIRPGNPGQAFPGLVPVRPYLTGLYRNDNYHVNTSGVYEKIPFRIDQNGIFLLIRILLMYDHFSISKALTACIT